MAKISQLLISASSKLRAVQPKVVAVSKYIPWDRSLLDTLAQETADDWNLSDPDEAQVSSGTWGQADSLDSTVREELAKWAKSHNKIIPDDFVDEAMYLVFRTLQGSGRSMTDGDLDHHMPAADVKAIKEFLKHNAAVRRSFDRLESKILDDAHDTGGLPAPQDDEIDRQSGFPQ